MFPSENRFHSSELVPPCAPVTSTGASVEPISTTPGNPTSWTGVAFDCRGYFRLLAVVKSRGCPSRYVSPVKLGALTSAVLDLELDEGLDRLGQLGLETV